MLRILDIASSLMDEQRLIERPQRISKLCGQVLSPFHNFGEPVDMLANPPLHTRILPPFNPHIFRVCTGRIIKGHTQGRRRVVRAVQRETSDDIDITILDEYTLHLVLSQQN